MFFSIENDIAVGTAYWATLSAPGSGGRVTPSPSVAVTGERDIPAEHADRGVRIAVLVGVTKCPLGPCVSMPGSPKSLSWAPAYRAAMDVKYVQQMSCVGGEPIPLQVPRRIPPSHKHVAVLVFAVVSQFIRMV